MPFHPAITQTAAQLRAKARDYAARGLHALAASALRQAAYVERRDKRQPRTTRTTTTKD